jgi:hypothetical protein
MNPDQEECDHVLNIINWYREAHYSFVEARRLTLDAIERLGLTVGRNVTTLVKSMSVEILSS